MSKREVERRHRRLAWEMAGIFEGEPPLAPDSPASLWVEHGGAPHGFDFSKEDKAAQVLADAESTQPAEREGSEKP